MAGYLNLIIKNATIVDGTGRDRYLADIGIQDERIVSIGDLGQAQSASFLDAGGQVVTPGFIDIHSHGDSTLFLFPQAKSSVMQGVTTIVGGNCGLSPAPLADKWLMQHWQFDSWDEIAPYVYYPDVIQPLGKVSIQFAEKFKVDLAWRSFGQFLDRLEKRGISVNYVPLVGHGQIRAQVMGGDPSRKISPQDLAEMKRMLVEALESGAHGLSTGLDYIPGAFSETAELIELARIVGDYGGIYATHWRRTGIRRENAGKWPARIRGIEEALEIGRAARVKVQISHLMNGYDIWPQPPDSLIRAAAAATLDVLDRARADGVAAAFDVIPDTDGGIGILAGLSSLLIPWLKQAGSAAQFQKNLQAADYRQNLRDFIDAGKWFYLDATRNPRWDSEIIILKCSCKAFEGESLRALAEKNGTDPLDMLFRILAGDIHTKARLKTSGLYDEAIKVFLRHPAAMVGTDSFVLGDEGWPGQGGIRFLLPHPNTYCGMIKYLTRYGEGRFENVIRRITGYPAEWLSLKDRGVIREGAYADLVIFSPANLSTNENYIEPCQYPDGISQTLVNGKIVVNQGRHTGLPAGKVLRRGR